MTAWRRSLGSACACLCLVGCGSDRSDRSVAGPGVDVHCAGERPLAAAVRPGVGDTSIRVTCPPQDP